MAYPGPGNTLPDGVVYKTAPLAQLLPPGIGVPPQYGDLAFAYHDQSESGTSVSITSVDGVPTLQYTNVSGEAAALTIAAVDAQGPNGFQFTDPTGDLWTVLDSPVTDGVALDPLFTLAESEYPQYAPIIAAVKFEIDLLTGGDPIVFTTSPLDGSAPCFARGTRIRTVSGEVAVEDLAAGDRVVLASGGETAIVWVGRRRVHVAGHHAPRTVAPVRIAPGALGDRRPERPLRVSPDHALFLDGVLVPAGLLVDGVSIVQETVSTVEYFHVELAEHAVLFAEGAPAESYLDTGNRAMFANAQIVGVQAKAAATCHEMVLDGERLEAVRRSLPGQLPLRLAS